MTTYSVVGKPVTRQEGPDKVSGEFLYSADVVLPGMLWGKVLRSPFPHARILHIDASRAERLPGVHAVITGQDTAGMRVGRMVRDVPLLAEEKVRFVGEKVAAVAADDPDTAEEALALIDVEYEPLPAIFDPLEAMEPGSPLVHEGSPTFESGSGRVQPEGNILNHATWSHGDLEQGFQESDQIFEHTFSTTWVHQGYMEPYACVVDIDAAGRIQVWANNKVPYTLRRQLADALGMSEDRILVNPCGIGGDFGGKSPAMNVPLAYFLSLRSGRPVKMIMNYIEELMAGNPRHPSVITIKTGVKRDGQFWARHSRVVYNGGAYCGFRGRPGLAGSRDAAGGQYHIPNFLIDSYMIYTNNVPCGSYRAPGQPQVAFAVESHTDMIAREMGIDPYELRLKNVVRDGQVCATGARYNYLRGEETLRAAAEAADWGSPKSGPHVGRGMSLGQRPQGQSVYSTRVTMDGNARTTLHLLVPETGTGVHTVGRQVVAEDLGLPAEQVLAVQMDTDGGPTDSGAGSGSSVGGTHAALGAAQGVRRKLTLLAAEFYGWPEERIVFRGSRVFVEGDPDQGVPLQELASRAVAATGAPISFDMTTPAKEPEVTCFCAQVAEVEVDPETGEVKVHKFVTAHDVGTIHNPLTHQGQIDGAVVQGVGYALMEELLSEEGRVSTLSMGEVKTPTIRDIPELVTVLVEA
ncbi:MAG: xanthine dehydrogenase family protein molybdopterin-binding subunit, partial [Dehalococcoidia bacterium]